MFTLGIDVGSSSSKAVILKDGKEVIKALAVQAGTGSSGPGRVLHRLFQDTDLTMKDMDYSIATGYGRFSVEGVNKQVSEITCHAKGIYFLLPNARTIIDIGGQDVKAISIDERGNILKFFMNDKCAAGTGRFLEVMACVLEISLADMGKEHFKSTHPAKVSRTCTVFAESEVISLLSQKIKKEDILYGIHDSVASKACALANRATIKEDVVMCGGVAQNAGVVDVLSKLMGKPITVAPHPQLTGALGAALIGVHELEKNRD